MVKKLIINTFIFYTTPINWNDLEKQFDCFYAISAKYNKLLIAACSQAPFHTHDYREIQVTLKTYMSISVMITVDLLEQQR